MGKPFNKRGAYRGRGANSGTRGGHTGAPHLSTESEGTREQDKLEDSIVWDALDESLGFAKYQQGPSRVGWLVNMQQVISIPSPSLSTRIHSGIDVTSGWNQGIRSSGGRFLFYSRRRWHVQEYNPLRALFLHRLSGNLFLLYSFTGTDDDEYQKGNEGTVEEWILRKFEHVVTRIERRRKEDLKLVRPHVPSCLLIRE